MLPNHSILKRLPYGHETQAMFAREPDGSLVVFVHGFGGAAISTWKEMHQLLPLENEAAGLDIVFYGYRSTKGRAQPNADLLRQFVTTFTGSRAPGAASLVKKNSDRERVAYRDILIVAHSLGAPIARQAVLDAVRGGEAWANNVRLLLFAPAHRGAFLMHLGTELMRSGAILATIGALGQVVVPMLRDLTPQSDFLNALHEDTVALIQNASHPPLTADRVVLAEFDRVVEMLRFGRDPASHTEANQSHIGICKAAANYRFPLEEVVRLL